jgi:hypothetical protein
MIIERLSSRRDNRKRIPPMAAYGAQNGATVTKGPLSASLLFRLRTDDRQTAAQKVTVVPIPQRHSAFAPGRRRFRLDYLPSVGSAARFNRAKTVNTVLGP